MIRFPSRALLASLAGFLSAGLARADSAPDINYFLPVTYQMVITRDKPVTQPAGREKSDLRFEFLNNRTLLRLILGPDTKLDGWSLVAATDSDSFTEATTFSSIRLVARHRDGNIPLQELPDGLSFAFTLGTEATSSRDVRDDAEDGPRVSRTASINQIATLTQQLLSRGTDPVYPAGTIQATGYLLHGTTESRLTGDIETEHLVLRPTSASFRASGLYFEDEDDTPEGIVELRISFGSPRLVENTPSDG